MVLSEPRWGLRRYPGLLRPPCFGRAVRERRQKCWTCDEEEAAESPGQQAMPWALIVMHRKQLSFVIAAEIPHKDI